MKDKVFKPEAFIFNGPMNPDSKEIQELVDKYRVLMGLTWHDFIYIGISMVIREDNEDLADMVLHYVKNRRKPGRPKGTSLKIKMRNMGVNPNNLQHNYK